MSVALLEASWPVPSRVRACSSLRAGGVSTGAHASLNVGEHVGDAPERVAENRARLAAALALPSEPCWLEQVHGTTVIDADRPWSQAADAAVSASPGRVLAIMTADCLPVLFADRAGKRVGAAHAGWRGLAAGVLRETVLAMQTPPAELIAWLGPAIGPAAFEVGREVRDAFLALGETRASAFERNERGRWQADLYALARLELEALGITGIHGGGLCTFSDTARFFSHRREAPCGRMVSLIWLIP